MKKKLKKWALIIGLVGMMVCPAYGCGKAQEALEEEAQSDIKDEEVESDAADRQPDNESKEAPEDDAQSQDTSENAGKEVENEDGSETNAAPSADGTASSWDSINPDLEGDIKAIDGMHITVIEAEKFEDDNGGEVIVSPGEGGDDSDFNKVTVTYDDTTVFSVKTIYNGGENFDVKDASTADLTEGRFVHVWGDKQADGIKATHIRIVKVE